MNSVLRLHNKLINGRYETAVNNGDKNNYTVLDKATQIIR